MTKRGRILAGVCACAAVALLARSAHATAGVECEALDGSGATVEMNLGRGMPGAAPNWVRVSIGDKGWSTLGMDQATPVVMLQSFDDGRLFAIDLAEDGVGELAIGIRVLSVEEGEETHEIGYLHLVGRSVHPISCINSE